MTKTVLITGASGNLGMQTVRKMLDSSYQVIAVGNVHNKLPFGEGTPNFEFRSVNLMNEEETAFFINDVIRRYEVIDAALLLVGGFSMGNVRSTDGEQLKKMYALNFETAYYAARPLFEHMLSNAFGRIVFVGARAAVKSSQGRNMIAYALSKSLLFKLAEFMNEESTGKNVTTSVIIPSTIDTPQNRHEMPDSDYESWVTPEQIADVLEFICSDRGLAIREPVYKIYNNA